MTEPRRKEWSFNTVVYDELETKKFFALDKRDYKEARLYGAQIYDFIQSEIMRNREDAVKEWTEQMVFLLSALDLTITLLKEIRDGKPQSGPLSEKIELVEDIMRKKGNKAFEISDEGSEIK